MKEYIPLILCIFLFSPGCRQKTPVEKGFIKAGGLMIYYEGHGNGPAIILLHAGFQRSDMWNAQVSTLESDYQVITVDLPGHGKSYGNDTVTLISDVLATVMDSLQIKTASFVGLSYGSSCVTDMALDHPERVEKIVLVSPGLTGWDKVIKPDSITEASFSNLNKVFASEDNNQKAAVFTEVWCDGPFRKPGEVRKDVREYIMNTTLENLQKHERDSWANLNKAVAAERIAQIKKPVLIIYGSKDIPIIMHVSHFIHAAVRGSKETVIPETAHMVNMEEPDVFDHILVEFLLQ